MKKIIYTVGEGKWECRARMQKMLAAHCSAEVIFWWTSANRPLRQIREILAMTGVGPENGTSSLGPESGQQFHFPLMQPPATWTMQSGKRRLKSCRRCGRCKNPVLPVQWTASLGQHWAGKNSSLELQNWIASCPVPLEEWQIKTLLSILDSARQVGSFFS